MDSTALGVHGFKLIDASTNRPIANSPVRVLFGGTGAFDARTNARGYVFIPMEKVMLDVDRVSIVVSGYQRTPLDFAAVRFKTRLQPK